MRLDFAIVLSAVPEGRMFGVDMATIGSMLLTLLNMSVLAIVLTKLLYKPVQNFLKKRTDRIQGQLHQAEQDMAKAAELKQQYEQKIADADRERDTIIEEARKIAAETSRQIVADAKKEAEAIKTRATANVDLEWEQAQSGMRNAIIEVSAIMAEKMVTLAINKEMQDKLFDETMAELEGMPWKK
jgi:F-type H+-transporting ATPase subunit b